MPEYTLHDYDEDEAKQPASAGCHPTPCSPSSFTPENDRLTLDMNGQDDATHLVELDKLSRKLEKQRDRFARIAQSYIEDLDDSGDEAGAKGIRRWVADIFSENARAMPSGDGVADESKLKSL